MKPIVAYCPACGAPLGETAVLSLAPICDHCGAVITSVGGSLGLTGVYGVNNPGLTRERVEGDLTVLMRHEEKLTGMLEACKEELTWGLERYAKLPPKPELLELKEVPHLWLCLLPGMGIALLFWIGWSFLAMIIEPILLMIYAQHMPLPNPRLRSIENAYGLIGMGLAAGIVIVSLMPHITVVLANGSMPSENRRRQNAYDQKSAQALKEAEPIRAARQHRVRLQIRELEANIRTVREKERIVRQLLETLPRS